MKKEDILIQNELSADNIKLMITGMQKKLEKIYLGGGEKKLKKMLDDNRLPARDRVKLLLDTDRPSIELGAFTGYGMYAEHGGCPAGGVIVYMGYIKSRLCMVVANDPTVKAGAWFPITGKKNLRAQEICMENRIPIVYLVDSAGVFLPMQDEIFPDKEHFGRMFRNNAKMSSMGIPQISAIMGSCVAGGAYLPIMSDEALIVEGSGSIFLAGPYLVKAAIGEDVDKETLGGAVTTTEISGITDYNVKDDRTCIETIRGLIDKFGEFDKTGFSRKKPAMPLKDPKEILHIIPDNPAKHSKAYS